jgi:hypothetical protein
VLGQLVSAVMADIARLPSPLQRKVEAHPAAVTATLGGRKGAATG